MEFAMPFACCPAQDASLWRESQHMACIADRRAGESPALSQSTHLRHIVDGIGS